MKGAYFLIGSLLVLLTSVSFLEQGIGGNILKLGSRKIIRQMKRIDSAKDTLVKWQGKSLYGNLNKRLIVERLERNDYSY